jgi:hypothetical protein
VTNRPSLGFRPEGPDRGWLSGSAAPAWTGGLALIAGYVLWARLQGGGLRTAARGQPEPARLVPQVGHARPGLRGQRRSVCVLSLPRCSYRDVQHRSATVTGLVLLAALMLRGPRRRALPTGRSSCDDGMRAANDAG